MIYFISDCHYNHSGSLKWNNGTERPQFENVHQMNQYMIDKWNSVVTPEDEVYFLGDFAYKCSKTAAESIFWQLNGKKHLIKGNHDFKLATNFTNCWESISNIKQIDFIDDKGNKQEIIMCHYPMLSWRHQSHGSWHLHGHTHGSIQELNKNINRYDCSVEVNNYTPISLDQLKEHFKTKI
jgi:calcineurin-like phosphoesterase family protein